MNSTLKTFLLAVLVSSSTACFVRAGPAHPRRYWWYAAEATPADGGSAVARATDGVTSGDGSALRADLEPGLGVSH